MLAALQQSGLLVCPEKMLQPSFRSLVMSRSQVLHHISFLTFMARKQAFEQGKRTLRNSQMWFMPNTF